jgi:hypothetical protein
VDQALQLCSFLNGTNVPLVSLKWNIWAILLVMMMLPVDSKKNEVMKDWRHPKTLKSLRGFLDLISYYKKFIRNYSKILAPLTTFLKKMLSVGMMLQNGPFEI